MKLVKMTILEKEEIGVVISSDNGLLVYLSEDGSIVKIQADHVTEKTEIKELTSKEEFSVKAFLMIRREYTVAKTKISNFIESVYETEITKNDPLILSHIQPILTHRAFKNLFLLQNAGAVSVGVDGSIVIKDISRPLEKQDAVVVARVLNVETQDDINIDGFLERLEKALAGETCNEDEAIEFLESIPAKVMEEVNNIGNFVGQIFSMVTTKKNSNDKENKETTKEEAKDQDSDKDTK